jgi:chemotaxis-related protein WspB
VLMVLFHLDEACYGVDCAEIAEVLPLVAIARLAHQPSAVAGLIEWRGRPVPVIDFRVLMQGRAARRRLSTRIILGRQTDHDAPRLGLIAEQAIETLCCDPAERVAAERVGSSAPYLDGVWLTPRGLVQQVRLDRLLQAALPN